MENENILFDTETYTNDEFLKTHEQSDLLKKLKLVLDKYVSKPRGQANKCILLARTITINGIINNAKAEGYMELDGKDLGQAILEIDVDRILLKKNNKILEIVLYNKNKITNYEVKSLSKSKANYYNSNVSYDSFENQVEFIETLPSLKIKKN